MNRKQIKQGLFQGVCTAEIDNENKETKRINIVFLL